jgi:hypothetical protein
VRVILILRLVAFFFLSDVLSSRESTILPEDMANQSVRLKEEQLRREEEKVSGQLSHIIIIYFCCWTLNDVMMHSFARLNSGCNGKSMRRNRSC